MSDPGDRSGKSTIMEQVRTWSLAFLAGIALIATLKMTQEVTVPIAVACLSALILSPVSDMLERLRIPRSLAALSLVFGSLSALATLAYVLAPEATDWRGKAGELARNAERALRNLSDDVSEKTGLDTQDVADGATELVDSGQSLLTDALVGAPALVAGFIFAAFLTYFLLAERSLLWRTALHLGSSPQNSLSIGRTALAIRREMGQYLFSITCINIALGCCAGVLFYCAGFPNPIAFAVGVSLLNFIPYLGPMVMNLVVLIVGLTVFGTVQEAMLVVVLLAGLNLLEGNLITPSIVGHRTQVSAMTVFIAVVFGAWLWGPAGAVIATPALIVGRTVFLRFAR